MSWARLKGHEELVSAFARVVERGRLAHAYLFLGPEGVGKRRFAVELARALLCENPPRGLEACDRCPSCIQVDARMHPDFQIVGLPEDKHEFPVALMQELIRNLALKPARGRRRIAILDDADDLNDEAANCFLKTLEEPPPASLLLLIGTRADRQLPTIRSRCQVTSFAPLAESVVADLLVQEGTVQSPEEARQLAQLSGGSMQQALALADPEVAGFRRRLLERIAQQRIDSVPLAAEIVKFVEESSKESAARRQRAGLVLDWLIAFLGSAYLLAQGGSPGPLGASLLPAARALAERVTEEALQSALDRCLEAEYQVRRRLQLVLVIEALIDALATQLAPSSLRAGTR